MAELRWTPARIGYD